MEPCKSSVQGVPEFLFHKLLFWFVVSNPFSVLEVGKKKKSKFFNLSPPPNLSDFKGNCTSNQNWAYFVRYLKIISTVLKNDISIVKQIVW